MRKIILLSIMLLLASPSYALNNYFCSANHQYINTGDSAAQVQAACGKPDLIQPYKPEENNASSNNNGGPQIWTYQAVVNPMAVANINNNMYYTTPNNPLRDGMNNPNPFGSNNNNYNSNNTPTFTVTIVNNQVTAVQGQNRNCGNWNPYPGVSSKAVIDHCGQPMSVNNSGINPYTHKMETWVYNNPYGPALHLKMTDGKLTQMDLGS